MPASHSPVSYLRPAIALVIPAVLFGVVYGYAAFVASLPTIEQQAFVQEQAEGAYEIEVTLTFTARPDWDDYESRSFYLLTSKHESVDGGRVIASSKQVIPPGEPLKFDIDGKVIKGVNQFDIFVGVGDEDGAAASDDGFDVYEDGANRSASFQQQRAVRVRILENGKPIADETIWSEPGLPIGDSIILKVDGDEDNEGPTP